MVKTLVALCVAGASVATAPISPPPPRQTPPPALDDLLARAGEYVQGFVDRLAFVISDEHYRQTVRSGMRVSQRTIQSEMLFWILPEDSVWLSIRNVLNVDGRPIPDSKRRLERVLAEPEVTSDTAGNGRVSRAAKLRALQAESARYDLGPVRRTTGDPTLVLEFLLRENQRHFEFTRRDADRMGGDRTAWRLDFKEIERPTVVSIDDQEVMSSGAVWILPEDGTVVRTNLTLSATTKPTVSVDVRFKREAKLEMWVPARMEEHYGPLTSAVATYMNYRRFETSARLVP